MLEREWVWWKQAIACQYGYSTSHVATVNYVIEVCLYPPLLPLAVASICARTLALSRSMFTYCASCAAPPLLCNINLLWA
jgi:hypothetical protein